MTRDETVMVLTILKTSYPRFYQGLTKKEAENTINLWYMMFAEDDVEAVKTALYKQIATNPFPPTIAEMRETLSSISEERSIDAAEAWEEITRAFRHYGYTREKEALESMNPMTVKAVNYMGGWQILCRSEDTMADRAHFLKIYPTVEKRRKEESCLPRALKEKIGLMQEESRRKQLALPKPEREETDTTYSIAKLIEKELSSTKKYTMEDIDAFRRRFDE